MNECDTYTIISNGIPREMSLNGCEKIKIFYDVPKDEKMYLEYQKKCSGGNLLMAWMEIHIHSIDEINGGGWNRGKFGKGQTNVIQ